MAPKKKDKESQAGVTFHQHYKLTDIELACIK